MSAQPKWEREKLIWLPRLFAHERVVIFARILDSEIIWNVLECHNPAKLKLKEWNFRMKEIFWIRSFPEKCEIVFCLFVIPLQKNGHGLVVLFETVPERIRLHANIWKPPRSSLYSSNLFLSIAGYQRVSSKYEFFKIPSFSDNSDAQEVVSCLFVILLQKEGARPCCSSRNGSKNNPFARKHFKNT